MSTAETLVAFYNARLAEFTGNLEEEIAHFNVFDIENVDGNMLYNRRTYYTITFIQGTATVEFEDKQFEVSGNTLLFTTPKVPYGLHPMHAKGVFCVFTESFITKRNSGHNLPELSIFKPLEQHIYSLSDEQVGTVKAIFDKMFAEKAIDHAFKDNLLRNHTLELIYTAQKFKPSQTLFRKSKAAEKIACTFIQLLEKQFPITAPQQQLTLRSANDFAEALAMHPNYLNRQLKLAKGMTTSEVITKRILQEAKVLLKLTSWNVSEIAFSLGFEEPSHFNLFFKKHALVTPSDYRK